MELTAGNANIHNIYITKKMHFNFHDVFLFTIFLPACFDHYYSHLQGDIITTIQRYKYG